MKKLMLSLCLILVLALLVQEADAQLQKTTSNDAAGAAGTQTDQNRLQEMTTILQKDAWLQVFGDEFEDPNCKLDANSTSNPNGIWLDTWNWPPTVKDPVNDICNWLRYNKILWAEGCDLGGYNHELNGHTLKLHFKDEPGNYEFWYLDTTVIPNVWRVKCKFYEYTTAVIQSLKQFLYGYFEIRCKIPNKGLVLWPSFWMWGAKPADTSYEIDVFEFNDCGKEPSCRPNVVGMNLHIQEGSSANHHPGEYIVTGSPNVTDGFHTYAVRWMPNSVVWLVDGQPVYMVADGHSPSGQMQVIAGNGVPWWCPPDNNICGALDKYPYDFEIDYIRVSRGLNKEFLWEWDNGDAEGICFDCGGPVLCCTGTYGHFLVADFGSNSLDEVLHIYPPNYAILLQYTGKKAWDVLWQADGHIGPWVMHSDDKYFAGNFDGDGKKELIAVASNNSFSLLKYSGGSWNSLVSGTFDPAYNRFFDGDFNGDLKDEFLMITADNTWARLSRYSNGNWVNIWDNGGSGKIAQWNIQNTDTFLTGDFNADGEHELVAIAFDGQSHLMQYSGVEWNWSSSSYMPYGDTYIPGRYEPGRELLLEVSPNGWAKLLKYADNDWQSVWGNDGGNTIHRWHMAPGDRYMSGRLAPPSHDKLLALSQTGRVHVIDYHLMVDAKSSPVIITIAPMMNAKAGKTLSFTVRGVNPDSALLHPTLSASGLPSSASFLVNVDSGTGVFNWTPTIADFGDHVITFFASDSGGVDSTQTDIKVSICGDGNGDGCVNVADAVFIINYIFKGGPAPDPLEAGDANCDDAANVADAVYLVNYIFKGGPAPCCP